VSRRAVLRLTDFSSTIADGLAFLQYMQELGCGPRTRFQYQVDEHGKPCLVVELPEKAAVVIERKERSPVRTKTQQAVRDRVEARQAAVAAGEPVSGHEKPITRRTLKRKTS
jgi:hypothetical protein